ncbi:helix-turn-helix transcriptional regulator [Phenylobacterium sp. J367]|uniref:helix-turn-helix transcriptional regulator n=1 Tax=Phenylobacterium sp. J367 TaxID=2898435 RepID=UPI0021511829|nr:hypothetical protein [Phenylobacterium sp. J367]MCR5879656.1 hypothetical protein [Phenylobacterium sp. J367]
MLSHAEHDKLVAELYGAAAGDLPWSALLATIASRSRIDHNVINVADANWKTLAVEVHGKPVEVALEHYGSELYANDPRLPYLQGVAAGSVYYDHLLYDVEAIGRDRRTRDCVDAIGVTYQLGVSLRLPEGMRGAFALLPTAREGHASDAMIAAFRRLAPHIEQAISIGMVVDSAAASRNHLLEALARKAEGMVLLDRRGRLMFVNDAARAILEAGDGLALVADAFATRRPPETRRLQQLVHAALSSPAEAPGGRVLVSRPSGRSPYVVSVMAAPRQERFLAGRGIACVIHIQDLAAARLPSHEALRSVFGLSDREAALAIELVRCASLVRAAANAGMAVNTARVHLQSISRKTGARGQAEVIQLLGRLAY